MGRVRYAHTYDDSGLKKFNPQAKIYAFEAAITLRVSAILPGFKTIDSLFRTRVCRKITHYVL